MRSKWGDKRSSLSCGPDLRGRRKNTKHPGVVVSSRSRTMGRGEGDFTHLDQQGHVFAEYALDMLGAQSVRERYVLFHIGDLDAARQCIACTARSAPPPFLRGVILVVVVNTVMATIVVTIVISGAIAIVSRRGARACAGDAVRVVVRDAQDSAVAEDVRSAERVHAAGLVQAGVASEYVRDGRLPRVAGAPGVPGHHDRGGRGRGLTVGIGGGGGDRRVRDLVEGGDVR